MIVTSMWLVHLACLLAHAWLCLFFQLVANVVSVLLKHGANPNLTAHGHSPLSLAIGSGNDQVLDLYGHVWHGVPLSVQT